MTYSTMDVCREIGATYRQVDFWCRKGLIPGQPEVIGSGSRRRWTEAQIERARLLLRASHLVNATLGEAVEELTDDV